MTGDELRAILAEKHRTQLEFAEYLGRTLRTVQRWCAYGDTNVPQYVAMTVHRLPAALNEQGHPIQDAKAATRAA